MNDTLPSFLFGPFQRYKRNTDRLASWLGATAESLGYYARKSGKSTGNNPVASSGSGRLKGKARKEAAKATQSAAGSQAKCQTPLADPSHHGSSSANAVTYFTTSEFISLAKFISTYSDPCITVPARIIDWARRAISERRQCASWFSTAAAAGRAAAGAEESNRSHKYFIEILESVVSILEPLVGKPAGTGEPSKGVVKVDPATVALGEGRFSALAGADGDGDGDDQDEDCDEQDDWNLVDKLVQETVGGRGVGPSPEPSSGGNRKPSKTTRIGTSHFSNVRRVYRVKDDDELDFQQAYMAYLMDVFDAHWSIKDLWRDYLATHPSVFNNLTARPSTAPTLHVAGLVTTAAVDAIQADYDSLCTAYPAYMANEQHHRDQIISIVVSVFAGDEFDEMMGKLPPSLFDETCGQFAVDMMTEATCLGERIVLESLRHVSRQQDWKERTLRPEDVLDPVFTIEMPSEILGYKTQNIDQLVKDMEELRAMYFAWGQAKPYLQRFASHILVIDTLDSIFRTDDLITLPKLLATKLFLAFHRLVPKPTNLEACRARVSEALTCEAVGQIGYALGQYDTHVPETLQDSATRKKHAIMNALAAELVPWVRNGSGGDHCEAFIRAHPWAAGVLGARALITLRCISVGLVDKEERITLGAYLYATVSLGMRQLGLAEAAPHVSGSLGGWWPHMNAFFEQVGGIEHMFAGRAPASMTDLFKALIIRGGFSPIGWTPDGLGTARQRKTGGGRPSTFKLGPLIDAAVPPVAKVLFKRFDVITGQLSDKDVKAIHQEMGECVVEVDGSTGLKMADLNAILDCVGLDGERYMRDLQEDNSKKRLPFNLLPIAQYLAQVKSALMSCEHDLRPRLLILCSQACRAAKYLLEVLSPHLPFLRPDHQTDFPDRNNAFVSVIMLLVVLKPVTASAHAQAQRKRILGDILRKMHTFIVEMVAAEPSLDEIYNEAPQS